MRTQIISLTIGLLLSLSSCGVLNNYKSDKKAPKNLYGEKEILPIDSLNDLAKLSWKELFTDPFLQDLIDSALVKNIDLRTTQLKVKEAFEGSKMARRLFLPSLALAPQGTLSGTGNVVNRTYLLPASMSWELDILTKINNKKETRAAYAQAKDYEQVVRTQLISEMATSYYNLLMLDDQLKISEEMFVSAKKMYLSTKALMTAGLSNEVAVAQMEASCHNIEASILEIKENINKVENAIALMLSETPHSIKRGKLEDQVLPEKILVGIPLQVLGNRPDVRYAEHALEAAFYATNKARSAFYPSITLTGTAGWSNSIGSVIVDPGKFLWQAIASLTQPLFARGQLIGNLKIAKARQEEAKLAFYKSILNAGREVNVAMMTYQTASLKSVVMDRRVNAMKRAFDATALLMEHGNTTYLEVLSAQHNYLNARLLFVANRAEEIKGVIELYHALGGGQD